jgi:hypothetical protein
MSTRFVSIVDSLNDIPAPIGNDAGIGVFGGTLFARTAAGFIAAGPAQVGSTFFIDPVNGKDTNTGRSPIDAFKTLTVAYAALTAGKNDRLVHISNGSATSSIRLGANFDWNKDATHFVGIDSGVNLSNRSRIAPTAGIAGFANFFTVSASGCRFSNVQFFQGFTAGVAASICLTVTGSRNRFDNCHIAGMGSDDAADGHSATSRNLLISVGGENQFYRCTIGLDTIARDVANASVEFAGASERNKFVDCDFLLFATANTPVVVKVAAAAGIDRFHLFDNCRTFNAIKSGAGTAITGWASLAAAAGGLLALINPMAVGVTAWGVDATSKALMYVVGPVPSTGAGIGVNPA